jgi:ribose/xylose/arabinose/galactoside ABC-type transport system permease subunit
MVMDYTSLRKKASSFLKKRSILLVLILICVFFSIYTDNFFTFDNGIAVLRQISILGIFATGLMFVMLAGYIDLSIGTTASFASVLFAMCVSPEHWNLPLPIALIITLFFSILIGCFNGFVITKTNMEPLIATLATSTILSGITYLMCYAKPIPGMPDSIIFMGQGFMGPIPIPVIILGIILLLVWFVLNKTYFGRYIYAVGSNSEAAKLSGVKTDMVKIVAYVATSLMAGLAGLVLTGRLNSGTPIAGNSYQMNALIACSVGGISLAGGVGGLYSLICGMCVLGVITNGMLIIGLNAYWQNIVQGAILITAVSIDFLQRKRSNKG